MSDFSSWVFELCQLVSWWHSSLKNDLSHNLCVIVLLCLWVYYRTHVHMYRISWDFALKVRTQVNEVELHGSMTNHMCNKRMHVHIVLQELETHYLGKNFHLDTFPPKIIDVSPKAATQGRQLIFKKLVIKSLFNHVHVRIGSGFSFFPFFVTIIAMWCAIHMYFHVHTYQFSNGNKMTNRTFLSEKQDVVRGPSPSHFLPLSLTHTGWATDCSSNIC